MERVNKGREGGKLRGEREIEMRTEEKRRERGVWGGRKGGTRERKRERGRGEKEAGGGGLNEEGQEMMQNNSGKPSMETHEPHHTQKKSCSGSLPVTGHQIAVGMEVERICPSFPWPWVTHGSPHHLVGFWTSVFPSDCVDRMKGCLLLTQQNVVQYLGVSLA